MRDRKILGCFPPTWRCTQCQLDLIESCTQGNKPRLSVSRFSGKNPRLSVSRFLASLRGFGWWRGMGQWGHRPLRDSMVTATAQTSTPPLRAGGDFALRTEREAKTQRLALMQSPGWAAAPVARGPLWQCCRCAEFPGTLLRSVCIGPIHLL